MDIGISNLLFRCSVCCGLKAQGAAVDVVNGYEPLSWSEGVGYTTQLYSVDHPTCKGGSSFNGEQMKRRL